MFSLSAPQIAFRRQRLWATGTSPVVTVDGVVDSRATGMIASRRLYFVLWEG
jgi:hypothetical protein